MQSDVPVPVAPPGLPGAKALAHFRAGMAAIGRGSKLEAARHFHQALLLQPDYFDALFNLALALQELKQLKEACVCYEQAVRLQPGHAPTWNNLGVALKQLGQWQSAVSAHREAVRLQPGDADFQRNLANSLRAGDRTEEAIGILHQGLRLAPQSAMLWHTLGNAWREAGRPDEAEAAFRQALAVDRPLVESHWDLAFALLLQGKFEEGWNEYEWRWNRPDYPARQFEQPAWQGEALQGRRLLVHAEQGAGDTIQFARYLPLLTERGARVTLECPGPLVRLLQTLDGLDQVLARGDAFPHFDFQCPLLSLPRLFRTGPDSIPARIPYLRPSPGGPRLPMENATGPQPLRVGLAWAGNPAHENDARRSIPKVLMQTRLEGAEAVFYSLQPRGASNFGKETGTADWVVDLAHLIGDYADTAALMEQLDLVISVDTSVAHLAGALGRPVWLLLPYAPDWRWLTRRCDSPWYPTMQIFRQPSPGDWDFVLKDVRDRLGAWQVKK